MSLIFNQKLADIKPSLIRLLFNQKKSSSIDLSLGEPGIKMPDSIWQKGLARFSQSNQGYTHTLGLSELRNLIADYYQFAHYHSENNVLVTSGSQEALFLTFFTLLNPQDEVIVSDPSYPAYVNIAQMCGANAVRVPYLKKSSAPTNTTSSHLAQHYECDIDAIIQAITPRTKLVVLSSPSNPLGSVDDTEKTQKLLALAQKYSFYIVSDEIYRELYFTQTMPTSLAALSDRVIFISGLSKCCAMTGFRLGYLMAPVDLIAAMQPVHQMLVTSTNTLAQYMAVEVFLAPQNLSAQRHFYLEQWHNVQTALETYQIPYIVPKGAFYVCCPVVPAGMSSVDFCLKLLQNHDLVCIPGEAFGKVSQQWIRLSFSKPGIDWMHVCQTLAHFLNEIKV